MALDLNTIKTIQGLITDTYINANFLDKLRESKEISITVSGITTKISAKEDEQAYRSLYELLSKSRNKELDKIRDNINKLLYSNSEVKAAEEVKPAEQA